MKKLIFAILGIAIALGIAFVLLRRAAVAPSEDAPYTSPTPTASATQAQIIVTSPVSGARVKSPIAVAGRGIAFENTLQWRLRDGTGKELDRGTMMTNAPDAGMYGNFLVLVDIPFGVIGSLVVEVYESSAMDGSEIHKVAVPVAVQ